MRIVEVIRRLRDEFTAMPGLRLMEPQVERLCATDASTSASALRALVTAGFLSPMPDGSYRRADLVTITPSDRLVGRRTGMASPWRRILCVVDFHDDRADAATAAGSALRYATTLAVTHRARITALHVVPTSPFEPARDELRKRVSVEPFRGLIDVQVEIGTPTEAIARVAREVHADLIVMGRGGAQSRLSETLRQAPCPVLIVYPSGRAAVA